MALLGANNTRPALYFLIAANSKFADAARLAPMAGKRQLANHSGDAKEMKKYLYDFPKIPYFCQKLKNGKERREKRTSSDSGPGTDTGVGKNGHAVSAGQRPSGCLADARYAGDY